MSYVVVGRHLSHAVQPGQVRSGRRRFDRIRRVEVCRFCTPCPARALLAEIRVSGQTTVITTTPTRPDSDWLRRYSHTRSFVSFLLSTKLGNLILILSSISSFHLLMHSPHVIFCAMHHIWTHPHHPSLCCCTGVSLFCPWEHIPSLSHLLDSLWEVCKHTSQCETTLRCVFAHFSKRIQWVGEWGHMP